MLKEYKPVADMTPEEVDEFLRDQGVTYPPQPKAEGKDGDLD